LEKYQFFLQIKAEKEIFYVVFFKTGQTSASSETFKTSVLVYGSDYRCDYFCNASKFSADTLSGITFLMNIFKFFLKVLAK